MAFYKQDIVDINLNTGSIFRSFLNHSIGFKNDDADRFGIRCFRDGEPVDLSGASCQAVFMAPNGVNIALTSYGTVSGNVAYVTLPPACYDYEGQFCLSIQLVGGGVTGTMRIVDGMVVNTGASGAVAPTASVPTYQEIIAQYNAMVAATSAANLAIAETFDATKAYPAGKYVINDGHLYRLTADHAANVTWANTSKVATNFGDDLSSLKSALNTDVRLLQHYPIRNALIYKNLMFTPSENEGKGIDTSTGELYTHSGTNVTDYIPAIQGKTIYFSQSGVQLKKNQYKFNHLARYDGSFNFLGAFALGADSTENMVYQVQTGDVWVRVGYGSSQAELQAEYDDVTEYHAFGPIITNGETTIQLLNLPNGLKNTEKAIKTVTGSQKTILLNTGVARYDAGYSANYCVTDFLMISMLADAVVKNAMSWVAAGAYPIAFYDANKKVIGTAYTPTSDTSRLAVDIALSASLLANYPNAEYIRIGFDSTAGTALETEQEIFNTDMETVMSIDPNELIGNKRTILLSTGVAQYNASYQDNYFVTDFIPLYYAKGRKLLGGMSWTLAGSYPIAFYDKFKKVIGTAYTPTQSTALISVDIEIDDTLIANYPGAEYIRIGGSKLFSTRFYSQISEIAQNTVHNDYPSYKVNAYPKIFFGGDSVTQGFVVEGTHANPGTIYQEMPEYSYPTSFGRIYAGADITKVAQSGISAYGYYYGKYPDIDFSEYNLIIIELGLNGSDHGYLNINDINTENTNTWCLKKLIEGIRSQNADAQIGLVRSPYYIREATEVFTTICEAYNAMFIDLENKEYLNLSDDKYHGYVNEGGTAVFDHAHYTRRGYSAKAYVVARLLGDLLPDS